MADQPRVYGTPPGRGKAINTGRTKAAPASPAQVSDYLRHMIEADRSHRASQAPTRGSSGGLSTLLAKGNPPVGVGGRQREAAIMNTVDKAAR